MNLNKFPIVNGPQAVADQMLVARYDRLTKIISGGVVALLLAVPSLTMRAGSSPGRGCDALFPRPPASGPDAGL
ncbi:MAG TPA: hypothetical protein VES20_18575 [Bryobacteraceae bacterium]|nr:hypothetical protein [Bryobacteraceae bacterium]